MRESKPIFFEPTHPVQTASWFNDKIDEYISSVPDRGCILLLANLMLRLEYRSNVMYCPDTYPLPAQPHSYSPYGVLSTSANFPEAVDTLRRVVAYFVTSDVIPDNDRGYWHTRLMQLLKSVSDDHIPKN